MSSFQKAFSAIDESSSMAKDYAEREYEHVKLRMFYQLSTVSVGLSKKVIIGVFLIMFLFFSSVSLALYLGEAAGSTAVGFLITSGIYLLAALTAYVARSRIEKYIINKLSKIYFDS
jgi:hypothetical protein